MANGSSSNMIVVAGLPRSGTTWLAKIFDSHPDTFYSHEPDTVLAFDNVPLLAPVASFERCREHLVAHVEKLHEVRYLHVTGKLPIFPKRHARAYPVLFRSTGLVMMKVLSRFTGDMNVPGFLAGAPDRAATWVWKSIESSGRLGLLARAFPASKFVFIVRHPCGVAASGLRGRSKAKFSAGPASEDFGFFELLAETDVARKRGLTLARFERMSPTERVAWRWALVNEKAMEDVATLDNCKVLRYEDLCTSPVSVTRELLNFMNLSWDAQIHRFIDESTSTATSGYYSVFKNPLESAFKWKTEIPEEMVEEIVNTVRDTKPWQLYIDQVETTTARAD